jgi:hypothetical protein
MISILLGWALVALRGGRSADFENGPGVEIPEDFDQGSHQLGPAPISGGIRPSAPA